MISISNRRQLENYHLSWNDSPQSKDPNEKPNGGLNFLPMTTSQSFFPLNTMLPTQRMTMSMEDRNLRGRSRNDHRASPLMNHRVNRPGYSKNDAFRPTKPAENPSKTKEYHTNFAKTLESQPVPVPPSLLKVPFVHQNTVTSARAKDTSSKLRICLRITPSEEVGDSENADHFKPPFLTVDSRRNLISVVENSTGGNQRNATRNYIFDSVFASDHSLREICSNTLTDLLQTVVNGSDSCLISFGHSSKGKSETLFGQDGSASELGLFPTAISWLFRLIFECRQKRTDSRFSVRISAVEVAGPQEKLTDLLGEFPQGPEFESSGFCGDVNLVEDPVFGVRLENVNEIRVNSVGKAAFLLDTALANRNSNSIESRRNSHLFFTLHIYQYKVENGKTGVAGGRSRLHLIDLGSGERNSKSGRQSLTFPAIGNVLLSLLQGQKYLPFRQSRLTQLLKESIGCSTCRSISFLTCISSDLARYYDTINTLQVACRLQRIKRQKKNVKPLSGNNCPSSGGESNNNNNNNIGRRLVGDPDCTASSSEQSCAETVIFLGALKQQTRNDESTTDGDSPPPMVNSDISRKTIVHKVNAPQCRLSKEEEKTEPEPHGNQNGRNLEYPIQKNHTPDFIIRKMPNPEYYARNMPSFEYPMQQMPDPPVWVDSKPVETWIDGPNAQPKPSGMDPLKREMIQNWVVFQEHHQRNDKQHQQQQQKHQRRESSVPLESVRIARKQSDSPASMPTNPDVYCEEDLDEVTASSFGTSDCCTTSSEYSSEQRHLVETVDVCIQCNEMDIGNSVVEDDEERRWIRFLEDIAEDDEDTFGSDNRSCRSSNAHDALADSYRTFGLDAIDPEIPLPLSILSNLDCGMSEYSFDFDRQSLMANDDDANDGEFNDEDLENAMVASMSSVRSHDILEKLKTEAKLKETIEQRIVDEGKRENLPEITSSMPPFNNDGKKKPSSKKQSGKLKALTLNCCQVSSAISSGSSNLSCQETIPNSTQKSARLAVLPSSGNIELTAKLQVLAVSNNRTSEKMGKNVGVPEKKMSNLPRPTTLPRPGWRRKDDMKNREKTGKNSRKENEKSDKKTIKSPSIVNCLKSPSTNVQKRPFAPTKRASSGYDSADFSDSPQTSLAVVSPYMKMTNPQKAGHQQRSSSGHGSDGGSSSCCTTRSPPSRRSKLSMLLFSGHSARGIATKSTRNRESYSASSGYDSGGGGHKSDGGNTKGIKTSAGFLSPTVLGKSKYFGGIFGITRSAPQSPSHFQGGNNARMYEDNKLTQNQQQMNLLRKRRKQVDDLRRIQDELKSKLREAKRRLCIPDNRWSFDVHAIDCLELDNPALIEAMEQETKILEKRLIACKSHVMMVTTFL